MTFSVAFPFKMKNGPNCLQCLENYGQKNPFGFYILTSVLEALPGISQACVGGRETDKERTRQELTCSGSGDPRWLRPPAQAADLFYAHTPTSPFNFLSALLVAW